MTRDETVIRGMECCTEGHCDDCPYNVREDCFEALNAEVREVLKERRDGDLIDREAAVDGIVGLQTKPGLPEMICSTDVVDVLREMPGADPGRGALRRIIDGLGCFTTRQHPCQTCAFNPAPGMSWPYGCDRGQRDIVDAARRALTALDSFIRTDWGGADDGTGKGA